MTDQGGSTDQSSGQGSRWLWLSVLTVLAIASLSIGKLLLAAGMLLMGVFAFFNNPLAPTPMQLAKPSWPLAASWACGLAGTVLIIAAAVMA